MKYKNFIAFSLLLLLANCIAAQKLTYDVSVDTVRKEVHVKGKLTQVNCKDSIKWNVDQFGISVFDQKLPGPDKVDCKAGTMQFSYTVAIPVKKDLNSPDPAINQEMMSFWGWHIFATPHIGADIKGIEVNFNLPKTWKYVTGLGSANPLRLPSQKELLGIGFLAGNIKTVNVKQNGYNLFLGIDKNSPIHDSIYTNRIVAIIESMRKELNYKPTNVFMGIRMLNGAPTFAPGNQVDTDLQSNILLYNSNTDSAHKPSLWCTYAHELMHAVNPQVIKDKVGMEKDFGPWFIEGFTSYLAYKLLLKQEIITKEQFLARILHSAGEYDYVIDKNMSKQYLEYSTGEILGLMVDLALIKHSKGQKDFLWLFNKVAKADSLKQAWDAALADAGGAELANLYTTWMKFERLPWENIYNEYGFIITRPKKYFPAAQINTGATELQRNTINALFSGSNK